MDNDFDIDLISRRALKHAILEHQKNFFSVGVEDVIALINDAPKCEIRPQGCESMKEKDTLISYVELSLKECDACVEKWRKRGLENVAIQFEGMGEAYSDILKILKCEKEITIWRD